MGHIKIQQQCQCKCFEFKIFIDGSILQIRNIKKQFSQSKVSFIFILEYQIYKTGSIRYKHRFVKQAIETII